MVAGGRNVRMNRQQMESRRKKQQIRWKSLLVRVAVLVVIVFCIRNIYARLEEMQMELERLEIQQCPGRHIKKGRRNPMKTKKFWNWKKAKNQETGAEERVLELSGTIAEDSWFDDDVTPQLFKDELNSGTGDITVWINSPGGDCVAAAQIYNMLSNYKGKVTVKIDGIAASAASVIAMAGDTVLVSPVSMGRCRCAGCCGSASSGLCIRL